MWGFLRVENEHLRIYGGGAMSLDADPSANGNFQHLPSSCASVSTMAGSSINSNVSSSTASIGGSSGGLGVPMIGGGGGGGGGSRPSGLDRLPYSRMEIPSSSTSGGLLRRLSQPLKAWCLIRVRGA